MNKNIYQNRKTGKKVITSEKLDIKDWKLIKQWRTGQMKANKIYTKKK